ncbi:MAG: cytochrome b N-terminal domain-containing protein [Thermodesulfovibrionales bacterium]|jgi:quinol-cytochrome oxidoreductase complex cytochrome b subunit
MGRIFDRIDSRFGIREPHKRFLRRSIPETIGYAYCMGGMAFTCFLILACTGLLLSLYYIPSEKEAFNSVVMITNEVPLGWLIRSLHKWAATLFIVFILLHTLRVIVHRAYRPPRELNWLAGSLSLIIAMASGFTGYLLPWDQKAYWATEVGTSMMGTIPLAGKYLMYMLRGGLDLGGPTLIRFYSLHILYLPFAMAVILWAHFHMVKRQGIARPL